LFAVVAIANFLYYRAAANGQLKCLPVLLERVNPFDVQNKEAMKHAFRLEVLFLYDADELCNVFRDIARTGFDLMLVAQDLEVLERQLSDGKLQPSTLGLDPKCQEQAVHQVSKALAAIRIALAEKGDGRSSGRSSNSRSSARPHADAKNPVEGSSAPKTLLSMGIFFASPCFFSSDTFCFFFFSTKCPQLFFVCYCSHTVTYLLLLS